LSRIIQVILLLINYMLHVNRDTSRGRTHGYTYEIYLTLERIYLCKKEIHVQKVRFTEIEWTRKNLKRIFSEALGKLEVEYEYFEPYVEDPRKVSIVNLKDRIHRSKRISSNNQLKKFIYKLDKEIHRNFSYLGYKSFRQNGDIIIKKEHLMGERQCQ
ncbi:MAG: hypothetical protein ACRCTZ_08270, partial [Sarcina sp.]